MKQLLMILPEVYGNQLQSRYSAVPEEVRISVGHPMLLRDKDRETWLLPDATAEMVEEILQRACRYSVYAHRETIKRGFITLEGGHRLGISGTGVLENGTVRTLTQISSLVLRMSRSVPGWADGFIDQLHTSTLVIGPPCSGKTTLLRDLVRQLSDRKKQRVSLVDERGEVSAMRHGSAQHDVGRRTDILTFVPKEEGIMMMLRTMDPQWIAVDEITTPFDVEALERASYCGVKLLATAHADQLEDLYQRPLYRTMMEKKIFRTVVQLQPDRSLRIMEVNE